jgi:N-methylhydantoinase B/oxoprolinase/acetone carboxylase alpha subunit
VQEINKMISQFGLDVVHAYMRHVQDNAEESVRRVIDALHDCEFAYEMDQGTVIRVRITVDKEAARPRSTSPAPAPAKDQLQRPQPVTRAATLYVFRCMVDDDIPMNAGCLKPIEIVIPEDCMLAAEIPRRRGRRQCRDQPGRHRHAVRRARRARRRPGHHEQPQFRQRDPPVLRDDLRRLGRRPGHPAPRASTPT